MDKNYLIAEEIVFNAKPDAVPFNYRISYKIGQLCLILSICCGRKGCSYFKLHMISMSLCTKEEMTKISNETYLPIIEGFDMKFDSSASDNIRAIWAFTMALMQTSTRKLGNHPNTLIFDEPDQHSIVIGDMGQFFDSIIEFGGVCQVIIGITIKDSDTKAAIDKLDSNKYRITKIEHKAFARFPIQSN